MPKSGIMSWRVGPFQCRLPSLGECSRSTSVSVYQLALLWEAVFSFSEFFLKTLSTWLPISLWVIYKHTCLHCTECAAVFDPKRHHPCATHSLFTRSCPECDFFGFPWVKKVLKGKCFANVEEVKQKTAESLKCIKID